MTNLVTTGVAKFYGDVPIGEEGRPQMDHEAWRVLLIRALGVPDAVTNKNEAAEALLLDLVWPGPPANTIDQTNRNPVVLYVLNELPLWAEQGELDQLMLSKEDASAASIRLEQKSGHPSDIGTDRLQKALVNVLPKIDEWVKAHPFDL